MSEMRIRKTEQPGKSEMGVAIVLVDHSSPVLSRVGSLLGQMGQGRVPPMLVVTDLNGAGAAKPAMAMRPFGPLVTR